MKNMLDKISLMSKQLTIMIIQLNSGERICALVKEHKKYLELYNPLALLYGVNQSGEEFIRLVPWQILRTVDSSNTIIRKKNCHMFIPSDMLKEYYLKRLTPTVVKEEKEEKKIKGKESKEGTVIDFTKFRKYKDNSANTPDPAA